VKWGRELALALVVAAAGVAFYYSLSRDVKGIQAQEEALFPGFDGSRVRTILAESTIRDWRVRLERNERGGWRMVDPTAVPANSWRVENLLAVALASRGHPVPASEIEPRQLGFEPPRLVLQIEELLDGKSHHESVEIGGLDADGRSVNVRVRGRYLRVLRNLDTALDLQLEEFKTDLALEFQIAELVAVRRSGQLKHEGEDAPRPVPLELVRGEEGWRSLQPEGLQLDPLLVGTWLQGLAALHTSTSFGELAPPLSQYGLDPPELRLELELRDGSKQALRLGRPGSIEGQAWYALREGLGLAWGFEPYSVFEVGWPLENLLDVHVMSARREDLTSLTLRGSAGELKFTAAGKQWQLALRRPGEKAFDRAVSADPAKVGELLSALEQAVLVDFRLGQALPEMPEAPAIWIGVGGITQGGWFGEPVASKDGKDCVVFQRRGENASSLAPRALLGLLARPIESFWSMNLADIPEHEQTALAIQGLGKDLRYLRAKDGKWARAGEKVEAKELYPVLDALCFLRAEKYLAGLVDPPWDEPVTVKFTDPYGKERKILVGRSREGEKQVELIYDKLRAVAHDQELHARLLKILEGT
jgi:Domain of unknown function (DUF4340)